MDINETVIDNFDGLQHLRKRLIKPVGNPEDRIKEDKLRIFRAVRFQAMLDGLMDRNLIDEIIKADISDIPVERIKDELLKILKYDRGLKLLAYYGLIYKILPEFKECNVPGGKNHGEQVNEHMWHSYTEACKLTENTLLRLAIFLHDIGKGKTIEKDPEKGYTFNGHEEEGEKIVKEFLTRLKFKNEDAEYLTTIVREHQYLAFIEPNRKLVRRLIRNLGRVPFEDWLLMRHCDNQGNLIRPRERFLDYLKNSQIYQISKELTKQNTAIDLTKLEIGGKELIELGMKPGPEMGKLLKILFEMVNSDEILNSKEALMVEAIKLMPMDVYCCECEIAINFEDIKENKCPKGHDITK